MKKKYIRVAIFLSRKYLASIEYNVFQKQFLELNTNMETFFKYVIKLWWCYYDTDNDIKTLEKEYEEATLPISMSLD